MYAERNCRDASTSSRMQIARGLDAHAPSSTERYGFAAADSTAGRNQQAVIAVLNCGSVVQRLRLDVATCCGIQSRPDLDHLMQEALSMR
jgi:hypothetical protein